jgi:hypothetical protein
MNRRPKMVHTARRRRHRHVLTVLLMALLTAAAALSAGAAAAALSIITPAPQETIHDNSGTVPVIVSGAPPGAALRPVLDGTASAQRYAAPAFELHGVPRGTHRLAVELLDDEGRVLASTPTVTFFVWQASRLNPPR